FKLKVPEFEKVLVVNELVFVSVPVPALLKVDPPWEFVTVPELVNVLLLVMTPSPVTSRVPPAFTVTVPCVLLRLIPFSWALPRADGLILMVPLLLLLNVRPMAFELVIRPWFQLNVPVLCVRVGGVAPPPPIIVPSSMFESEPTAPNVRSLNS